MIAKTRRVLRGAKLRLKTLAAEGEADLRRNGSGGANPAPAAAKSAPSKPKTAKAPAASKPKPAAKTPAKKTPSEPEVAPVSAFKPVAKDLAKRQNSDPDSNIEWNKTRWGQEGGWLEHDGYGYNWSAGSTVHYASTVAKLLDTKLRPHLDGRYDLDILEISPGAGRVTVELIRYAKSLTLVDLNEVPIELCKERLKYYPNEVHYFVNDGKSLAQAAGSEFDLIVSYDSLVHVHPDIVRGYLTQGLELLRPGGIFWFDHSGKGATTTGRRSDITDEMVASWAGELGAEVVEQTFRNERDCLSVIRKRP